MYESNYRQFIQAAPIGSGVEDDPEEPGTGGSDTNDILYVEKTRVV